MRTGFIAAATLAAIGVSGHAYALGHKPAPSKPAPTKPPASTEDSAELVSADVPARLESGASATARITFKNTGTATWTSPDYKLGGVGDADPLGANGRVELPQGTSVPPGQSYTFEVSLRAPANAGKVTTRWQMVHELVRWFGPISSTDVTIDQAFDPMSYVPDVDTLEKKLVFGYQGWFSCAGDGVSGSWVHWCHGSPGPGSMTVDLWPDTRECDPDELFDTGLRYPDGRPAKLWSSHNRKTVVRHFRWMKENGIDGVMLQRFSVGTRDSRGRDSLDNVLQNARAGAEANQRVWNVMYDTSGHPAGSFVDDIERDWRHLVDDLHVTDSPRYQKHKGRPVVSIWGLGVGDRPGVPDQGKALVAFFENNPDPRYRVTLKLGISGSWRTQNDGWAEVYRSAHVISPWLVGAYRDDVDVESFTRNVIKDDLAECKARGIDYMPVVFPGFSWQNLTGSGGYNPFPRRGGRFWWKQFHEQYQQGCTMFYGAMFDEVDEGTAMFKIAETAADKPTAPPFVSLDADGERLPSDFYLKLAGQAGRQIRGEVPHTSERPIGP